MPSLISRDEIDAMDYSDDSYDEPMSTEMLEDIRDRSQSHLNVNRREACYKYVIILSKNNMNGNYH